MTAQDSVIATNSNEPRQAPHALPIEPPAGRRLKVYAFDPSVSTELDTSLINQATLTIPWEDDLKPGPVGEYIEVVDVDPASGCVYLPVDLNNPYLLARDGLDPSEGNPHFHQQMTYAVTMKTLRNFEQALGRPALWSPRQIEQQDGEPAKDEYVRRLRIYPHAIRTANAYYSPEKKALLLGYFTATGGKIGKHYPGGMVFTCLSQDIIAHETAHALLDGMHRRFVEPSNEDGYALHEGFADIVALFQRFAMSDVLRHQIARTRGDLANHQHLLSQLARQFGQAMGHEGALRNALGDGQVDSISGRWKPSTPDPEKLGHSHEAHDRGAILVAAVFDAFLAIYKSRIEDLTRLATKGTGILPEGEIQPDLISRMAVEASKTAQQVLNMCIRAMDYLPPVDVTFGDYLRALITADADLVPNDARQYRLAFLAAFRGRGIYPQDIRSLSVDSLRWRSPNEMGEADAALSFGQKLSSQLQGFANEWRLTGRSYESHDAAEKYILALNTVTGTGGSSDEEPNRSGTYREAIFLKSNRMRQTLQKWLLEIPDGAKNKLLGLDLAAGSSDPDAFEVHAIRPVRRVGPDDRIILQMIIEITQKRPEWFRAEKHNPDAPPDFYFRGGATVIVDMETGSIRYIIRKPINDPARLKRQRDFLHGQLEPAAETDREAALRLTYFGRAGEQREPFAILHRSAPRSWENE